MRSARVNADQLVIGLLYLGIAAGWALKEIGAVEYDGFGLIVPLALLTAGLGGLAAFVVNRLRGHDSPADANPVAPDGFGS